MNKHEQIRDMWVAGLSYAAIARAVGLSRQRVQKIVAPPKNIRNHVVAKYGGECVDCGLLVNGQGHIHHEIKDSDFTNIDALVLLCPSCHRLRHIKATQLPPFVGDNSPCPSCGRREIRFRSTARGKEFICRICGQEWPANR